MQAKEPRRSIKAWRFCVENRECTNEDILKQTRSILDWMRVEVRRAPDEHGYTSGFDEFEEDWDVITGEAPRCTCKGECRRKNCACRSKAQRCGRTCHPDGLKCQNPFGCMARVAEGWCWAVERYLDKFIEIFVQ